MLNFKYVTWNEVVTADTVLAAEAKQLQKATSGNATAATVTGTAATTLKELSRCKDRCTTLPVMFH